MSTPISVLLGAMAPVVRVISATSATGHIDRAKDLATRVLALQSPPDGVDSASLSTAQEAATELLELLR